MFSFCIKFNVKNRPCFGIKAANCSCIGAAIADVRNVIQLSTCIYVCANHFRFPKAKPLTDGTLCTREKWINAINRQIPGTTKKWFPGEHDYVCSEHFKEEDFYYSKHAHNRLLKPGVVPSINLGKLVAQVCPDLVICHCIDYCFHHEGYVYLLWYSDNMTSNLKSVD